MTAPPSEIKELQRAVERLHNCSATYVRNADVREEFGGRVVWEGTVSVFNVTHPDASTCYAWSSPVEGSARRRYYAILGKSPIQTAVDAVRATIAADHRNAPR